MVNAMGDSLPTSLNHFAATLINDYFLEINAWSFLLPAEVIRLSLPFNILVEILNAMSVRSRMIRRKLPS